jgi:hypothetical protein
MSKDVLYTDWSMEFPDPIWCEECEAVTNYGEECTCEEAI